MQTEAFNPWRWRRAVRAALLAVAVGAGAGCGGGDSGAPDAGDGGDRSDARDVPVADSSEIMPMADPRPRMFVPQVVPLDGSDAIWNDKQRMAIFWFGRVDTRDDYVQCRVGTSAALLMMQCAVFDREIYDEASDVAGLDQWDSLNLSFDLDGDPAKTAIDDRSFRIDAQAGRHGTQQTAIYRGAAGAWTDAGLELGTDCTATPDRICIEKGYRGEDRDQSRGWHVNYCIPWTALGLSGRPAAPDNLWNVALAAYDRDSLDGALRGETQFWPGARFDDTNPSTWGTWEFLDGQFLSWEASGATTGAGRPAYSVGWSPPPTQPGTETTATIRAGLDGDVVENAAIGASERLCSGDDAYNFGTGENSWGGNVDRNYFHIQNQEDYADWPCFARIYLKFPLTKLPTGKVVVSATLRLHHSMPTSAGPEGDRSLIQAFRVADVLRDGTTPWDATNITWNDAPLAIENLAGFWGDRTGLTETGWDDLPEWYWDVTRAVAGAVGATHVSFALYSADSEYHTGKQFVQSSDFPDWGDPAQRPTLEITYADPAGG